jgi:YD repeat-containing protein
LVTLGNTEKMKSRIIICFLCTILTLQCSCGQNTSNNKPLKDKSSLEREGFKGKVKKVRQDYYAANDTSGLILYGEKFDFTYQIYLKSFNERGNITEQINYTSDSSIKSKHVFKYEGIDKLTEHYWYYPDGRLKYKLTYKYNEKGFPVEVVQQDHKGRFSTKHKYTYDNNGNLVADAEVDARDSLKIQFIYAYDMKGCMINTISCNPYGVTTSKQSYTYDESGKLIEKIVYADKYSLFDMTYKYVYDDKENQTEEIGYDPNGIMHGKTIYTYKYDDKGNWIERIEFKFTVDNSDHSSEHLDDSNSSDKSDKKHTTEVKYITTRQIEYY